MLYFVTANEGKIRDAKKWLSSQEGLDAPQITAKRWRAIQLQHDGKNIHQREWRHFRGQYALFRRKVEDCKEGHWPSCLLNLLLAAWVKRVTKEEAIKAKGNHSVKMMLNKEHHRKVVPAVPAERPPHYCVRESREGRILRLEECEVGSQAIRLQAILASIRCNHVLHLVGEEGR